MLDNSKQELRWSRFCGSWCSIVTLSAMLGICVGIGVADEGSGDREIRADPGESAAVSDPAPSDAMPESTPLRRWSERRAHDPAKDTMPEARAIADPRCAAEVLEARKSGAAQVTSMLRDCHLQVERLQDRVGSCVAAEPDPDYQALLAQVRELDAIRTGTTPPAEGFDPLSALASIQDLLASEETAGDAATRADLDRALAKAEVRIAALERENARLLTAVEAAEGAPPAEPLITREQIEALAEALFKGGDCDALTVTTDPGISVSGVVGSADALNALREPFAAFAAALPGGRLAVEVQPGGTCNVGIGGGWVLLPDAKGAIGRIGFGPEIEAVADNLPTPVQLEAMGFHASEHPDLGSYFQAGQTPQVWCRRDSGGRSQIGVCKREAYSEQWNFQRARGRGYTAFPVLRPVEPAAEG